MGAPQAQSLGSSLVLFVVFNVFITFKPKKLVFYLTQRDGVGASRAQSLGSMATNSTVSFYADVWQHVQKRVWLLKDGRSVHGWLMKEHCFAKTLNCSFPKWYGVVCGSRPGPDGTWAHMVNGPHMAHMGHVEDRRVLY